MRYLGIDFGSKRVGLAISDESSSFAMPLSVVENTENLIPDICKVCIEKNIGTVVVGESLDFSMKENNIMKEVTPFIKELKLQSKLPVVLHPEFLTSAEAEHLQGKNNMLDASAAALILKSYLDTKNNTESLEN